MLRAGHFTKDTVIPIVKDGGRTQIVNTGEADMKVQICHSKRNSWIKVQGVQGCDLNLSITGARNLARKLLDTANILEQPKTKERLYERSVDILELSTRSANVLHREGITTIGQLAKLPVEQMMKWKQFGSRSAREILEVLDHLGCIPDLKIPIKPKRKW